MLLRGTKVRLRPIAEGDLKELYQLFNDPAAWGEYEDFEPVDWFTFEKRERERSGTPGKATFLIIEKMQGKSIIGIVLHRISHPVTKTPEIGYVILKPSERGKGYASEAARLLVDYLYLHTNIERIEAYTDTRNKASHRVLEKCGFKREGRMRRARYVAAVFRDYYIYGLIRGDWKPPKE